MTLFMVILTVTFFVLLLLVVAVQPRVTPISRFELERRVGLDDQQAIEALAYSQAYPGIYSLQQVLSGLLLVGFNLSALATFGWLAGGLMGLVGIILYGAIARMPLIKHASQRIYKRYESAILHFVTAHPTICRVVRTTAPVSDISYQLHSKEELLHVASQATAVLTADERRLIQHGLQFGERQVQEIMIPRSAIDTVKRSELLGPLALNDLHQTGHSRFPVIDGDNDHIVGILHIQDLLTLGDKKSLTAEKAMEPRVYYIREDQSLQHALAAFLRTHHHLFVVINQFRETVGIITLEDVIEALLGRQIIDEFDNHEDLRAVALRLAHAEAQPAHSQTV